MELSEDALKGLRMLGSEEMFSEQQFKNLMELTFDVAQQEEADTNILELDSCKEVDRVVLKQAYASLITLFFEAVKHNVDGLGLAETLEDVLPEERVRAMGEAFESRRDTGRGMLFSTGFNFPHVVDVDWRLDYYMKSSHLEKIYQPVYFVTLKTEVSGETKDISFSCNQVELQDIVNKLKDAQKQVERIIGA